MSRPVLVLFLLCSACVSHQEYPDNWSSEIANSSGCPDISGTYELVGHCSEQRNTDFPFKGHLLQTHFWASGNLAPSFGLTIARIDDDRIQVLAGHGEDLSESQTLSLENRDFECEEGKLWISRLTGVPPLSVISAKMGFVKAADGSLVGEDQAVGAGLFYIIPIPMASTDYCRWDAIKAD